MSKSKIDENKDAWFRKDSGLSEGEKKFCRCTLRVKNASNVYAVCAHSTHHSTGRRGCGQYYDFNNMPTEFLQSYANLHNLSSGGSREQILSIIAESKRKEGK